MSHSHALFLSHILLMTCSKPDDSVLLENDSLPTLKEASYTEEELNGPLSGASHLAPEGTSLCMYTKT